MSDNTTLPATGTGTANIIVATDKIGGADYQRVKLALGDDGTAVDAPTGAGTEAGVLRVTVATDSTGVLSVDDNGGSLTVDGTFYQTTQPVSAAALPLPTGAATAAKQPALGTAGTPSADVLSVQGVASMTALKVDGSGVTQPVSGTVTANAGTNLNTSALATQTTLAAISAQLPATLGQKTKANSQAVVLSSDSDALAISGAVTASGTVDVQGTTASSLGKAEDAAHASGDTGVMALTVRKNTAAATSGTDGDYQPPITDTNGLLWVNASGAAVPITDNSGSLTVDGTFWQATQPVSGTVTATVGTVTAVTSITNVVHVDDNAGSLTVDGTFWQATQPVSIATAPVLVAGSALIGKVGIDQTTPGTTDHVTASIAAAQTLATVTTVGTVSTITNVVHVDDNSGSLTVDGTVTADTELNAAAALADAASATVSTATVGSVPLLMNATTLDRARAVINALDSTGIGIAAAGMVGQFDDASVGTVTENQFAPARLSSRRAQLTEGTGPTTATTAGTQVASSASSVTLLSSNALRRGFMFYNNSTSVAYVLFGTTASATSFNIYMLPGASYEMFGPNLYSGRIDAIWVTANGNMQVAEW